MNCDARQLKSWKKLLAFVIEGIVVAIARTASIIRTTVGQFNYPELYTGLRLRQH